MTTVRITLSAGATLPKRGSAGASGYDLVASHSEAIDPGSVSMFHTGVCIELPDASWEAQIRPRSSMTKRGLIVPLGSIDSDYRGDLTVVVINAGHAPVLIQSGDRIAQLVFGRVEHPTLQEVVELSTTERGAGGFGSSGR